MSQRSGPVSPVSPVWQTFSTAGRPAHFYHANGFALGAYEPLLSRLAGDFALSALALRPTWPGIGAPPSRRGWQLYADDLIAHLEQHAREPVIGIGHSMGATCTALAAVRRPELFRALVLIEPAMVSRPLAALARAVPKSIVSLMEPARSTLRKPGRWPSREAFVASLRNKKALKRLNDEALAAFARHGLRETVDGQFELVFPPSWEAHNYTQPPNAMAALAQLDRLGLPCVAMHAKPSVFFTPALWKEWQQRCPHSIFVRAPEFGHLLPLEGPTECRDLILDGLQRALPEG